jgi:uncharacterized protein YegP (UPF0339 family)
MSTRESKYEIWRSDKNNEWYWHFKASNGENIATGQGYTDRRNCLNAISLLQRSTKCKIYSLTPPRAKR